MGAPLARGRDRGAASRRTFIPQQLSTLEAATTPRKDSAGAWVWPSQLLMVPAGHQQLEPGERAGGLPTQTLPAACRTVLFTSHRHWDQCP